MEDTTFAIAKMSTKGQIVIPKNLRDAFKAGEEFLVIRNGGRLILKSMSKVADETTQDLAFAMRVEEAYTRYDAGAFKKVSAKKFLEDIKKW